MNRSRWDSEDCRRRLGCRCLRRRPRGLSTLEMVLALPILLFVMALMVNYGSVASWKVRALTVARHETWANRWPRNANLAPRTAYWPKTAGLGHSSGNVPALADARLNKPVMRGPLPYGVHVDSSVFDPTLGMLSGSSDLDRDFSMLGKMGKYHLEGHNSLLDNQWEYQRTSRWQPRPWADGWRGGNVHRRIPDIYELPIASSALQAAFLQAIMTMLQATYRSDLRPLDNDDEFLYYTALYFDPFHRGWTPNFIRRMRFFCDMDLATARAEAQRLADRIQGTGTPRHRGLPYDMARSFIGLYWAVIAHHNMLIGSYNNLIVQDNAAIAQLTTLMNATPPPTPTQMAQMQADIARMQADIARMQAEIAQMQTEIAPLQAKIQVLTQFLNTIP